MTPPEGGKGLRDSSLRPEEISNAEVTPPLNQIRAEATTTGRSAIQKLKMWSEKTLSYSGTFRQDLYNYVKMPHPGQSHNVVIYTRADVKHDSRLGGYDFDLPNRPFLSLLDVILHAKHIRARFKLLRTWFLSLQTCV